MVVDLVELVPRKRRKLHADPKFELYAPGSIVRCKLRNFMSYSLTEFHCNPHMNLIIGPNGSGKSTFVCAVCIGLCGKIAYLGKESMTVDQFIKEGEESGYIELELKAHAEDVAKNKMTTLIRRDLHRKAPSVWTVDGENLSERQTKKLLETYNIQLDNLCQFLPQDRVSKFGDLKPEELLREIERSYQDGELLKQHEQLCVLHHKVQEETKEVEVKTELLQSLQTQNQELEAKAKKHKEYVKLQNEINRTKLVVPFFKLEALQEAKKRAKAAVKDKESDRDDFKAHFQHFYNELNDTNAVVDTNEREIMTLKKRIEQLKDKEKRTDDQIAHSTKLVGEKLKSVEELQSKRAKLAAQLNLSKETLTSYEEHKDRVEVVTDVEFKKMNDTYVTTSAQQREISAKKAEQSDEIARVVKHIQKLQTEVANRQRKLASTDRLDRLDQRRHGDLMKAIKYLRANENTFEYCEPPLLTASVQRDVSYAFDQIIPTNIKNSFVVKNLESFRMLTDVLFDQAKIRASVRSLTNQTQFVPRVGKDVITNFGFDGYLVDFVSGPSEVVQMLCENTHLHEIPISIKGIDSRAVEKFQHWNTQKGNPIVKFIVGDHIYTSNKSRYGKKQVNLIGSTVLRRPNLFAGGISEEQRGLLQGEMDRLAAQIETENTKLEGAKNEELELSRQYAAFTEEANEARRIHLEERGKRNKREKYELRIQETNEKIEQLESQIRELDSTESNCGVRNKQLEEVSRLEAEKLQLVCKYLKYTEERLASEMSLSEMSIKREQQKLKADRLRNIATYLERKTTEFEKEIGKLKNDEKHAGEEFTKFKKEYSEQVKGYTSEEKQDMKEYIKSLKAKFASEQDQESRAETLEEIIEREVTKMKSKLALAGASGNSEAVDMLETNRRKIQKLTNAIPHLQAQRDETQSELTTLHEQWRPELDRIVRIVDADFGTNMRAVASGGSVTLDDSVSDYSKWKLVIKVSFRDAEDLTQFNGAQHSGGEKSTTTAVFLNSLQGLTNTPFRVVDEINQGMDAKNERNAHRLIVSRATDPNVSAAQYFLITPKLLTDLHYSERMSVHCIFAGKWTPMFKDEPAFLELGVSENYLLSR